jgi:hypothetical protein
LKNALAKNGLGKRQSFFVVRYKQRANVAIRIIVQNAGARGAIETQHGMPSPSQAFICILNISQKLF